MSDLISPGQRIRHYRMLLGMTQKALGIAAGFPPETADIRIAQYESGARTPKHALLCTLAEALGVSPSALDIPRIKSREALNQLLLALEDESTAALFRSSQAVSMGCSGSRTVDNGRTAALSRLPVRSFSSIGTTRAHPVRRTGSPIMSASWRNAKTALSTPSRAIPATAADSANIRWDTTKF